MSGQISSPSGFETYVNWWDSQWQSMIDSMPMHSGMTINIAFDNWGLPLDPATEERIVALVKEIRKAAIAKGISPDSINIKLSFGGATYGMPSLNSPQDAQALANQLSGVLQYFKTTYGIDFSGIDLDIESGYNQAQYVADFIHDLRANIGDKVLSLTIPGQAWAGLYYQLATDPNVQDDLSYFQIMEYDIWQGTSTLKDQIEADLDVYLGPVGTKDPVMGLDCWGIPPSKLRLGLMPGKDDMGHTLDPKAAEELAQFAKTKGLSGVMIWDTFRDGEKVTGYDPFIFSIDLINTLYGSA